MKQNIAYQILRKFRDGTLPPRHRIDVKRWFISGHEDTDKETAMLEIWNESSSEVDETTLHSLTSVHHKIKKGDKDLSQRFRVNRLLRYAAILTIPLITGVLTFWLSGNYYMNMEMTECYVPNGELRTVVLSDGSQVQINSGTVLIYPEKFRGSKRTVFLSGEACFSVAKNTKKPFIVRTGPLNVEVLGTRFDIEAYPGSGFITTTLEEGSVKVYREDMPEKSILMKPNEQIVYYAGVDSFATNHVYASDFSIWTQGELRFRNKTLNEILATIERRYNVRFQVDEGIACTDLYTMKFKSHETIEDALHVFSLILENVSYKKEGQTIRLYPKRKEVRP